MSICDKCERESECPVAREDDFCLNYVRKPQTHADCIREKSDEELAEFLGTLPCCPPGEDLEELCFPLDSCEGTDFNVKCWLKWLRQEASQKEGRTHESEM